jgi:D-alanyl-D-alanine dipeptidase
VKTLETIEQKIEPQDLVDMAVETAGLPVRIEVAYARDDNFLFGERIYRSDAKMWLHKALAGVVVEAAKLAKSKDLRLVLYDGLRTTTAQASMLETRAVKAHPHWLEEPRLLSPPGAGAHPRGMAIDVSLETLDGALLDMGSVFDYLSDDPTPAHNIAHRDYAHSKDVRYNRAVLDGVMVDAARIVGVDLLLLPQEWWDFRLPVEVYGRYAPLSDEDLPPPIKMCD